MDSASSRHRAKWSRGFRESYVPSVGCDVNRQAVVTCTTWNCQKAEDTVSGRRCCTRDHACIMTGIPCEPLVVPLLPNAPLGHEPGVVMTNTQPRNYHCQTHSF